MRMLVLAAAVALSAGAAQAQTDAPPPPWSGVWQGTVGDAKVEACFGVAGDPDGGSYYYLRHLKPIALEAQKGARPTWTEGFDDNKTAPSWTLAASDANALTGSWSGGGKTLPIKLSRVALTKVDDDDDDSEPCGNLSYTAPRIAPPTVTRTAATLDGVRYTKLTLHAGAALDVSVSSFALDASTPAAARLNAALAKTLPGPDASANGVRKPADYVACLMWQVGSTGDDGDYADDVTPSLITRHWLVTEETNSSTCGGAHPNASDGWKVWDLTTGNAVDAWSWFNTDGVTRSSDTPDAPQVGPKLRAMLVARWTHKGECKDVLDGEDFWDVHPTRTGLTFWPQLPHVVFACSEDVVVPYRDLAPLLNAKGRAAIASIVEDLKGVPPAAKHK